MSALLLAVAAIAVGPGAATPATPAAPGVAEAAPRATLVVRSTRFGRVLFDGRGRVLYGFTVRRREGRRQVTYNGWPLYYYAHEGPGEIKCQNVFGFGGLWFVVRPSGRLVR